VLSISMVTSRSKCRDCLLRFYVLTLSSVMLPALQNVRGGFNLQSKQNVDSSCARFKPLSGGRASPIKGKFVCKTTAQPQSKGNGNGGSSTSGGSSSSSSSPANPILISGATGVLGVVAAIFGML